MTGDRQRVIEDFDEAVNLTPGELEEWLQTEDSRSVGQSDGGGESKGHESGRRIVEIKHKNKSDYTDDDLAHMRRVVGDVENSNWRYSLMNWGHDPLK